MAAAAATPVLPGAGGRVSTAKSKGKASSRSSRLDVAKRAKAQFDRTLDNAGWLAGGTVVGSALVSYGRASNSKYLTVNIPIINREIDSRLAVGAGAVAASLYWHNWKHSDKLWSAGLGLGLSALLDWSSRKAGEYGSPATATVTDAATGKPIPTTTSTVTDAATGKPIPTTVDGVGFLGLGKSKEERREAKLDRIRRKLGKLQDKEAAAVNQIEDSLFPEGYPEPNAYAAWYAQNIGEF